MPSSSRADGVDLDEPALARRRAPGRARRPRLLRPGRHRRRRARRDPGPESPLAPLHNPAAVAGIEAARAALPTCPHVAVFDTAFFADPAGGGGDVRDPARPRRRAPDPPLRLPRHVAPVRLPRPPPSCSAATSAELNQIVLHLGNGCSASAVRGGVAVETSMGLTPLQGLVMGTRSGDVDPGLHTFLHDEAGLSVDEIDTAAQQAVRAQGAGRRQRLPRAGAAAGARRRGRRSWRSTSTCTGSRTTSAPTSRCSAALDVLMFTAGVGENNPGAAGGRRRRASSGSGIAVDPARNAVRSTEAADHLPRRVTGHRAGGADQRGARDRPPGAKLVG